MKTIKGDSINALARLLEDIKECSNEALLKMTNASSAIDKVNEFLLNVDNNDKVTFNDVYDSYENLHDIFDALYRVQFPNIDEYDIELTELLNHIIRSIDIMNPNTVNTKMVSHLNIVFMGTEMALKKFGDSIYILNKKRLETYCSFADSFLYNNPLKSRFDSSIKCFKELQKTVDDVYATYKKHKIICDDMKEYLCDCLEKIYGDWREEWNIDDLINTYNNKIIEQENHAKEVEALRLKNKQLLDAKKEEENIISNGISNRINELVNYYDLKKISNLKLNEEEQNILIKYTDVKNITITDDNIHELDTLLSCDIMHLERILAGYSNNKLNMYLNLLIRTYVIKNMMNNLLMLLKIIPNIEMKKFDAANYLNSLNRKSEVELVNNFKQLIYMYNYLDSDQNNNELLKIESNYNGLTLLVYYFSVGLFTEEEYINELNHYKAILENHLSFMDREAQNEDVNANDDRKNTTILLTDSDDISFVEKNILNDITKVSDQAIAFDKIIRLESIDVHSDIDGHICKNENYTEELLKRFHFKSANFSNSRIYYGAFTNSNREKLVIIYGIRTGNMDNNSKTRYYKEVINNQLKPNEDYIMGIIDAFNNDKLHFEKYIAKSEEAKDHFKNTLKENGYKFENVNTLEME